MALMSWLTEKKAGKSPFLVVCPTSVLSHWERKIQEHAPALCPVVYHGTDRELDRITKLPIANCELRTLKSNNPPLFPLNDSPRHTKQEKPNLCINIVLLQKKKIDGINAFIHNAFQADENEIVRRQVAIIFRHE